MGSPDSWGMRMKAAHAIIGRICKATNGNAKAAARSVKARNWFGCGAGNYFVMGAAL